MRALLVGGALLGTAGVVGCSDDDDGASRPGGPPPLATKSIGVYEFDNPQAARDADSARRATARYLNEKNARNDGYEPASPDRPVCSDPPGKGDGGIEYVNGGLLDDGEVDGEEPEVLIYEPSENATRRLSAVQYRTAEGKSATLFGREFSGSLTVWLFRQNPDGPFEPGNVEAQCPPGPARDTPPPEPAGGPPGASGDGGPPGGDGDGPPGQ